MSEEKKRLAQELGFKGLTTLRELEAATIQGARRAYDDACSRPIGRGCHTTEESEAMLKARKIYCQKVIKAYAKYSFEPPEQVAWWAG